MKTNTQQLHLLHHSIVYATATPDSTSTLSCRNNVMAAYSSLSCTITPRQDYNSVYTTASNFQVSFLRDSYEPVSSSVSTASSAASVIISALSPSDLPANEFHFVVDSMGARRVIVIGCSNTNEFAINTNASGVFVSWSSNYMYNTGM